MAEPSLETQVAVLQQWKTTMEAHIANTDKEVQALKDERNSALKWGIMTLGTTVMGMAYWIVNQFTGGHFK